MALSVFADESADGKSERVFAVAGVIGPEDIWERVETEWTTRTGDVPFHATDCDTDRGDYASTDHATNKSLYRDLTTLLAESGLAGWGFAIDLAAQRRVFPGALYLAYYKCFIEVIQAMTNCARNNRESVQFTFDARRESEHNAGLLYRMFHDSPGWKESHLAGVSFQSSRDQPRIQVADLFARETMKVLDNVIVKRKPRKSWLALYGTGSFHVEAIGEEWFLSLKSAMPTLERRMGMSWDEYPEWLGKYGLHDNTTNRFRYMEWCKVHKPTIGDESKDDD